MSTRAAGPVLVLWDVDHTLIDTGGVSGQLYRLAFRAVTGQSPVLDGAGRGRTERAIFAEALRLHGIEMTEQIVAAYLDELARTYERYGGLLCRSGRALPGARDAVRVLADHPGVVQTVLTGNLRGVAERKLRTFGLGQYIDFEAGAYGDEHLDRATLVPLARQRAGARYRSAFAADNTVIIGDTVSDVQAAHRGGARILAVATGPHSVIELRRAGADVVMSDLTDKCRLLKLILGI